MLPSIKARISKVMELLSLLIAPVVTSFIAVYSDYMLWIKIIIYLGVWLLSLEGVPLLWYCYLCATNSFIVKSEKEPSAEPESNVNETID